MEINLYSMEENKFKIYQVEVEVKENYKGYSMIEGSESFQGNTAFLTRGAFNLLGE